MREAGIGILGLTGIFLRYAIDRMFLRWTIPFPAGTLTINLLGSFLAGAIYLLGERGHISADWRTALLVGLCGGFTTFSAYALQSFVLLENRRLLMAIAYLAGSSIAGVAFAFLGVVTARFLREP